MSGRVLIGLVLFATVSCAGRPPAAGLSPDWINSPTESLAGYGSRFLYGKGRAEPNITNVQLSKMTARERARVDLAVAIAAEVQFLLPEPAAERLRRPVVEAVLPRHRIVARQLAPDGSRYALAWVPYSEMVDAVHAALADANLTPAAEAPAWQEWFSRRLTARRGRESL